MKHRLTYILLSALVVVVALSAGVLYTGQAHAVTQAATQASCDMQKTQKFLGVLPTWYEYLTYTPSPVTGQCEIQVGPGLSGGYWLIGLAVIDILVHLAGFVAVVMVIYGAVRFIISQGEPENTKVARETIVNALIGIVIVLIAIPALRFIGDTLGGPGPQTSSSGIPLAGTQSNFSLQDIFNAAYMVIGALAVLMLVIAGFRYIISGGNPQNMTRAREAIIYTVVGVVLLFAATGIINFVVSFF